MKRAAILLAVPVGLALLTAIPLGLWHGEYQWLCAAVALAVVFPPSVLTLLAAGPLARSSPLGPLLVLVVGTFGRIALGFGGATVVYFASGSTFRADPISYWAWVLGAYLATLAVETVLLARDNQRAVAASGQVKA